MRTWLLKTLCLLTLAACAPLVHAQTQPHVYHCIGAHGEPVFSGQPCGTLATPPGQNGITQGSAFGDVCAGSPQELRQDIAGAFTSHDVNRLAGLILWRGMDQDSARATLRSLAEWLQQPLIAIAIAYAAGPPFADTGPVPAMIAGYPASGSTVAAPTGFEISTGGGDGSTHDFGIMEFGGCWWLTF